jgi:hypothetical protein
LRSVKRSLDPPGAIVGKLAYGVAMATWDDVRRLALALPQTVESSSREGRLRGSGDCGEQTCKRSATPLPRGRSWPRGCLIGAKEALLAEAGDTYFTTPHFDNYPAILVRLD